jgi:hypothetical protein
VCRSPNGRVEYRLRHLRAVHRAHPLPRALQQRDAEADDGCQGSFPQEDAKKGRILSAALRGRPQHELLPDGDRSSYQTTREALHPSSSTIHLGVLGCHLSTDPPRNKDIGGRPSHPRGMLLLCALHVKTPRMEGGGVYL